MILQVFALYEISYRKVNIYTGYYFADEYKIYIYECKKYIQKNSFKK